MVNVARLALRPKIFHTLTGLTPVQFTSLLTKLTPPWEAAELERKSRSNRKRKIGGGDKPKLDLAGDLFMTLLYYRTYAGQVFIGLVMGLDNSNVSRRIRRLEPVLQRVFKIPTKKINLTPDELWELIVDATEQPTLKRPGTGYSGKKKQQTIKTQIHVAKSGLIKAVSASVPGNMHDKKLYDQTKTYARGPDGTPHRVKTKGDLGYLGTECDIPLRKPESRLLMMHELYANRQHAKERVQVEHSIAHLKQFGILGNRFRGNPKRYNLIFRNVAGVRNLALTSSL